MKDYREKYLNLLIHGIRETGTWEKRKVTLALVKEFLHNALKIPNSVAIKFADCHRLPQHPLKSVEENHEENSSSIQGQSFLRLHQN